MDLRRIVEEVETRKRYELSLVRPAEPSPRPAAGGGAAGSLLHAVRTRMLAENPGADVGHLDAAIKPGTATAPAAPPTVTGHPAPHEKPAAPVHHGPHPDKRTPDDFVERYIEMSAEFERRSGVKGWADFVAKKARARAPAAPPRPAAAPEPIASAPSRKRTSK